MKTLLLIAALAATGQAGGNARAQPPRERGVPIGPQPIPYDKSHDRWAENLNTIQVVFHRLRIAAGFTMEELRLSPLAPEAGTANAVYATRGDVHGIALNRSMVMCADIRTAVVSVLAHEISHAVQHREGLLTPATHLGCPKEIEAQADHLGRLLAVRAGFAVEGLHKSWRDTTACIERSGGTGEEGTGHPSNAARLEASAEHVRKLGVPQGSPVFDETALLAMPVVGRRGTFALRAGRFTPPPESAFECAGAASIPAFEAPAPRGRGAVPRSR